MKKKEFFVHLWTRSIGLVEKSCTPPPHKCATKLCAKKNTSYLAPFTRSRSKTSKVRESPIVFIHHVLHRGTLTRALCTNVCRKAISSQRPMSFGRSIRPVSRFRSNDSCRQIARPIGRQHDVDGHYEVVAGRVHRAVAARQVRCGHRPVGHGVHGGRLRPRSLRQLVSHAQVPAQPRPTTSGRPGAVTAARRPGRPAASRQRSDERARLLHVVAVVSGPYGSVGRHLLVSDRNGMANTTVNDVSPPSRYSPRLTSIFPSEPKFDRTRITRAYAHFERNIENTAANKSFRFAKNAVHSL